MVLTTERVRVTALGEERFGVQPGIIVRAMDDVLKTQLVDHAA